MKFFTKEWYQTMQNSGLGCLLQVDPKAEDFSEAYYRKLYREIKDEWLQIRREMCDLRNEPFDANKEKREFDIMIKHKKQRYATNLPKRILDNVADIRVLALDRCTQYVKDLIGSFAGNCREQTENDFTEYENYAKTIFDKDFPAFFNDFVFHDSLVRSMRKRGNDYILSFESETERFSDVERIVFKDFEIIESEKRLAGAWWLYEEVHKIESGYEVCVLLDKNGLFEFSIRCKDIVLG